MVVHSHKKNAEEQNPKKKTEEKIRSVPDNLIHDKIRSFHKVLKYKNINKNLCACFKHASNLDNCRRSLQELNKQLLHFCFWKSIKIKLVYKL